MSEVRLSQTARDDLERFVDHLLAHESPGSSRVTLAVLQGLRVLRDHPLIGRPRGVLRELVLGHPPLNYVALYAYDAVTDVVIVHALRHQKERSYR